MSTPDQLREAAEAVETLTPEDIRAMPGAQLIANMATALRTKAASQEAKDKPQPPAPAEWQIGDMVLVCDSKTPVQILGLSPYRQEVAVVPETAADGYWAWRTVDCTWHSRPPLEPGTVVRDDDGRLLSVESSGQSEGREGCTCLLRGRHTQEVWRWRDKLTVLALPEK